MCIPILLKASSSSSFNTEKLQLDEGYFPCRTIKDWNKLPEHIINSTSAEIFRERLTHDVLLKTLLFWIG
jgi:hypothetical protein